MASQATLAGICRQHDVEPRALDEQAPEGQGGDLKSSTSWKRASSARRVVNRSGAAFHTAPGSDRVTRQRRDAIPHEMNTTLEKDPPKIGDAGPPGFHGYETRARARLSYHENPYACSACPRAWVRRRYGWRDAPRGSNARARAWSARARANLPHRAGSSSKPGNRDPCPPKQRRPPGRSEAAKRHVRMPPR